MNQIEPRTGLLLNCSIGMIDMLRIEHTPKIVSIIFHADREPYKQDEFNDRLADLMLKYRVVSVQASVNLYPHINLK